MTYHVFWALIVLVVVFLVLRYLFPLICVCETSMLPTFKDQEIIIGTRVFRRSNIKVGDIVIYHSPNNYKRIVIKRVVEIKEGFIYCVGDNRTNSYDSRNYGWVPLNNVICIPLFKKGE